MKKNMVRLFMVSAMLITAFASVSCSDSGQKKLVYFLIDRTGTWQPADKQHFQQTLVFLKKYISETKGGVHVVVATLNQMSTSVKVLYEGDRPDFAFYENAKAPSARKRVAAFNAIFESIGQKLTESNKQGVASPIVETLYSIVSNWKSTQAYKTDTLMVFSDMVQYTNKLKFAGSNSSSMMTTIQHKGILPDFAGADVYVFGAGNFDFKLGKHASPKAKRKRMDAYETFYRANKKIWAAYFKKANANLKFYGSAPI